MFYEGENFIQIKMLNTKTFLKHVVIHFVTENIDCNTGGLRGGLHVPLR